MIFKKILAGVLSATLLVTATSVTAFAKETKKEYNYVALGDSIAAGFGLSSNGSIDSIAGDPALILTDDLIANPVMGAYSQVFGQYLAELGQTYGYTTTTTNLSSTAYRAVDVENVILNEGYKGEVAEWILETFIGEGGSAPLANYHDIYSKYLPEAELVSIQLGGNDIVMNILYPILKMNNPVLMSIAISLMLTLFGCDTVTALGGGLQYLMQNKDTLTFEAVTEAAQYFANVGSNGEYYVNIAAEQITGVVDAVKTVNPTTDIVLIGMFNPYGNSLEYEGQVKDISTIIKNIFARAATEVCGKEIVVDEDEELTADELDEATESLEENVSVLSTFTQKIRRFTEQNKEIFAKMAAIVADEIAYPMQYLTAGKNVDPQMTLLNEKLKVLADEKGCTFVDVYNISNECNLDPHPGAQGHREIAEIMKTELTEMISEKMTPPAEKVLLNRAAVTLEKGQNIQLNARVFPSAAVQSVKWSSSNRHVATVDENGVVTAKKAGTAVITAKTSNGKKVTCTITVKKPQKVNFVQQLISSLFKK